MSDSRDQAQFRQHLSELRSAAGGIGRDFAAEFSELDRKIERLGHVTSKESKYLLMDIQDDFRNLGHDMDEAIRNVPGHIVNGGTAVASALSRAGVVSRDAISNAGHRAKVGTQNALASAAGVRRTPMKEWSEPTTSSSDDAQ
jgi:hypothetical protein